MLIIIISRSSLKLDHVGSKTRLLGHQATQVSDLGPLWPSCLTITSQSWCWLVGCFGLNGPLRQYFSLYWAVSHREKEKRNDRREKKCPNNPPPASVASTIGPCPTLFQISRTPWHWKFTQHHRATRPPPQSW